MGKNKIDKKIKELQSVKKWLQYKLQSVELKMTYSGIYSSDSFVNNSNEDDDEISRKINAYNMLIVNLPQDKNKISNAIRYNFYRWYGDFRHCYSSILEEYKSDVQYKENNNFSRKKSLKKIDKLYISDENNEEVKENSQEQSGTFRDVISCLFGQVDKKINNSINKSSKVEVKQGNYFHNLKNAWESYRNSNKNKVNPEQNNNSKMEVNFSIMSFANYTNRLIKQFDLETYNLCYSRYQEIIESGLYENVALSIRENFEKIKEMVNSSNKFIVMSKGLDVNNIDECLYKKCMDLYNQLYDKYGKDILIIIPSDLVNLLNDCDKKLKIQKDNQVDNMILNSIKKVMDKILFFQLESSDESFIKCEKILSDSYEFIHSINGNEYEKLIFNNQELLYKFNRLKEVCHNLYGEFVVTKFTKLVNDSFNFKNNQDIKYDDNQLVYCIEFYNRMSEEDKKAISKDTMQIYNDALRFNSILTLKTMLNELDVSKCVNNNRYDDIYYCCSIYDRFYSKLRCGKSKGGNDMAKRRRLGREEIEKFPNEIKDKLINILNIRSELITQKGEFKVSYFDALVNRKNRHFAFVSVLIDDFEVEKITVPLTCDNSKDEVYLAITKKYPDVDIERIKFDELGVKYQKVL